MRDCGIWNAYSKVVGVGCWYGGLCRFPMLEISGEEMVQRRMVLGT